MPDAILPTPGLTPTMQMLVAAQEQPHTFAAAPGSAPHMYAALPLPNASAMLSLLMGFVSQEINLPALEQALLMAEITHPGSNPIPAVIAAEDQIFIDPAFRSAFVAVLQRLAPKVAQQLMEQIARGGHAAQH